MKTPIYAPKIGVLPEKGGGVGSPCKTMSPWPMPTFIPSGILIHLAVWPQQTWAAVYMDAVRKPQNWGEGLLCPFPCPFPLSFPLPCPFTLNAVRIGADKQNSATLRNTPQHSAAAIKTPSESCVLLLNVAKSCGLLRENSAQIEARWICACGMLRT